MHLNMYTMFACPMRVTHTVHTQNVKTRASKKPVDIYRETPLRYLGYANEVGESFTAFLPSWGVPASYAVAATYVMMDTVDKAKRTYDETNDLREASKIAIDTCAWQMLASIFWPGSFIRLVVAASSHQQFDYIPTIIGLLTIPLIVKPIDETVDAIMEKSVKKVLNDDVHSKDEILGVVTTIGGALIVPHVLYTCADLVKR